MIRLFDCKSISESEYTILEMRMNIVLIKRFGWAAVSQEERIELIKDKAVDEATYLLYVNNPKMRLLVDQATDELIKVIIA